jgi:phenylalanyl-tRNA synthetase alpha chain
LSTPSLLESRTVDGAFEGLSIRHRAPSRDARAAREPRTMSDADAIERDVLAAIARDGIADTMSASARHGVDHQAVVGVVKRLTAANMVVARAIERSRTTLTAEGERCVDEGSPEARAFACVPEEGIELDAFRTRAGPGAADVGFKQAMQRNWLAMVKGATPRVERRVETIEDDVREALRALRGGETVDAKTLETLTKKRKLAKEERWKEYELTKGAEFALERKVLPADLTKEMMNEGSWRGQAFKAYNLVPGAGAQPASGHVHPLLKVRQAFREIFFSLGFSEMPTNNFVESGFWNFDTLIQPQQHPARDAHDTFFMKTPATMNFAPEDYVERVRKMHETGGNGSIGHQYAWKRAEADKNILRTHTTAVSARMLYDIAQTGFKPARMFSIDRVFRNEAVDRTHLAEFHQVEGVICDKDLTLGDLIGVLYQFFERLGMTQLRFKPAFNPYTEPSMEIFAFHPMLDKWVEVGNSGMFRPEMLEPMGLPEDVNVIAWGLSLERPTMIMYGIDNIRDLFGSKMQITSVKNNPICTI